MIIMQSCFAFTVILSARLKLYTVSNDCGLISNRGFVFSQHFDLSLVQKVDGDYHLRDDDHSTLKFDHVWVMFGI